MIIVTGVAKQGYFAASRKSVEYGVQKMTELEALEKIAIGVHDISGWLMLIAFVLVIMTVIKIFK